MSYLRYLGTGRARPVLRVFLWRTCIFSFRLRYKGSISQQGKKLHKSSFVTVDIFSQLKCLLESE